MDDIDEDFSGITPSYVPRTAYSAPEILFVTNTLVGGLIPPPAYANTSTPYYAPLGSGGGGGGAVDSVSAGAGLVVSPTTGAVIVSMPNVGDSGVTANPASIATDAQGRVTSVISLGYTPVNPTELSAYAPLAGATFTGAVSGIAPTVDANLTTKLYVDNAVAGGGSGVYLPLAGGTMTGNINMSGNELTFVSKVSNATGDLDLSGNDVNIRQLDAGTEELPNVLNITSAGATAIASGGAITCSAVGAVNLTSGLSTTIFSTAGTVQLGGPINNITIASDGQTVTGVKSLTASATITGNAVTATGVLTGASVTSTGTVTAGGITSTGAVNLTGSSSVTVPTPTLDTQATTKLYVDSTASTTPSPFIKNVNNIVFTTPTILQILDTACVGGTIFLVTTGPVTGGAYELQLPASSQLLPVGTTVILQNVATGGAEFVVSEALGGGAFRNNNIYRGGSLQCVVSNVAGAGAPIPYSLTWTNGKTFNSISLSGTDALEPVVGPVVFQSGTANIQCDDIQTSLISANAPASFISVEDPLQTRILGVRSSDGSAPAEIAMALSESAIAPNILTMKYDPAGSDSLEVNKNILVGETLSYVDSGAVVAVKTADNFFQGVLVQNKSATANASTNVVAVNDSAGTDYVAMGINSSAFTNTYNTLFEIPNASYVSGTADTVIGAQSDHSSTASLYMTYNSGAGAYCIDSTGALSMNASRPAGVLDKGAFGSAGQVMTSAGASAPPTWETPADNSDWSTYPATQAVAMDTNAIDNAGNITSISTIEGSDLVATNSILVGVDSLDVETTLKFTATNEFFVALNGNDTTNNGSSLLPFLTIARAVQASDAITPKTGICVINIANGTYTENITISGANSGWIQLNGSAPSQNNSFGVVIDGNIAINIDSGPSDLISRQVILTGLELNGTVVNSSTESHTVIIQNCRFYPNASTLGRSIFDNNTATLGNRVLVDNCEYTNDTPSGTPQGPFIFTGKSTISFSNCDIQSPTVSPVITCGGTSFFQRIENCYIESSYNTPTQPLVSITSTSTSVHNILLNSFNYTTGSGTTIPAIYTSNGGTLFVLSNTFNLVGTNVSAGNVIGYAGTAPALLYKNNSAVPTSASGIQSGITLLPLVGVGSEPIKATTVTATGIIKSSGTLQLNANAISNASNNTTIGGVNSLTMAGSMPQISGVNGLTFGSLGFISNLNSMTFGGANSSISSLNSLSITNSNATVPLRITNSGDNPNVIIEALTGSDAIPVELTLTNGAVISAIGNGRNNARGNFWYANGADALQISNLNRRVVQIYSPSSPCFATSGALGAFTAGITGVAFTSTVPYLIGTEIITLSTSNFPIPTGFNADAYLGLQGTASYKLNGNHELATSVFVTRTRAGVPTGPFLLYGSAYNTQSTNSGFMTQTLNGISYNEATPASSLLFRIGDIVTFTVFATFTGGSPPQMSIAPVGLSAVISPVLF
jgi:hypothetical protein